MVGGPGTAWPAGATLIGLSGPRLRQVGIALVGIGLLLFFLSFVPIFLAFNSFMQNPFGSAGSMFGSFFLSFLIGAVGILLLGVGGFALRLGLVRPVTSYVATEAAPAIQTAATAFGAGIREAGFGAAGGAGTGVRVEGRNCGYLETENAGVFRKSGHRVRSIPPSFVSWAPRPE